MAKRRSRQVEIFNFSFLDILACTIGLLIFIMVMVFILQSNSPIADTSGMISRKLSQASGLQTRAENDAQIATALERQFDEIKVPEVPDLTSQRVDARRTRDVAKRNHDLIVAEVNDVQMQLDTARLAREHSSTAILQRANADLAVAQQRFQAAKIESKNASTQSTGNAVILSPYNRPGFSREYVRVLHVDCHATEVVMFEMDERGRMVEIGQTNSDKLDGDKSLFHHEVEVYRHLDHATILFWVRPDGASTYESAVSELPPSTEYGSEPANMDWSFFSEKP